MSELKRYSYRNGGSYDMQELTGKIENIDFYKCADVDKRIERLTTLIERFFGGSPELTIDDMTEIAHIAKMKCRFSLDKALSKPQPPVEGD